MTDEICPALTELREPLAPEVRRHLLECRRCKALVRYLGIEYRPDVATDDFGGPVEHRTPPKVSSGDLCAAVTPALHHRLVCVVTAEDDGVIEVVPISDETQYASDRDMLLDADLLGYETMAEVWNMGSLLIEDIEEVLARLDDAPYEQLVDLIDAAEDGSDVDAVATGAPIVFREDARHDFQQREAQRARPFFASSSLVRSASSVPELIALAAESTETPLSDLSRDYGPLVEDRVHWVEDLLAERIDIREVPGHTIGALFAEFELRPSQRLAAIVWHTGWSSERHEGTSRVALIGSEHETGPTSDADEYIAEVFEGLIGALSARTTTDR